MNSAVPILLEMLFENMFCKAIRVGSCIITITYSLDLNRVPIFLTIRVNYKDFHLEGSRRTTRMLFSNGSLNKMQRVVAWLLPPRSFDVLCYWSLPIVCTFRFDEELIHTVCGILEINCFEVRCANGQMVRALYPQTAIMSHSCVPNTAHTINTVSDEGLEEYK